MRANLQSLFAIVATATTLVAAALLAVAVSPPSAMAAPEPVNHAVAIDLDTDWQPPGGAFRFNVSPALAGGATTPVVYLCPTNLPDDFFDKATGLIVPAPGGDYSADKIKEEAYCEALTVQAVQSETTTPSFSKYQAALGGRLSETFVSHSTTYISGFDNLATNGLFRRLLTGGWLHVHVDEHTHAMFRVGVTWRPLAALLTIAVVFALAWTLARFAKTERVRGPGKSTDLNLASLPIRLISGVDGRASLSQFQIMLWTFVVLGGAVYVVLVNGALIPISSGTLVLLGISGGAAVIAQAKATQDAKTVTPTPTPAPGPVADASVKATPSSSDLIVTWSPPANPSPVQQYRVGYKEVGTEAPADVNAFDDSVVLRDLTVRLVGLAAGKSYVVKVRAETPAGHSDWTVAKNGGTQDVVTTNPNQTVAASAPASAPANPVPAPADFDYDRQATTASSITLTWTKPSQISSCCVQFRRADSREDWSNAPQTLIVTPDVNKPDEQRGTILGLVAGVTYNFRVRAQTGVAVWSDPVRATTTHAPRWSDLVVDDDQPGQLDVTRVQMLLFTLVTAGFVTIKIIDSSVIPEVPQEYLVLMGISNGVYLTAKWARR